jgi:outer membrane protein assembly factor BamB
VGDHIFLATADDQAQTQSVVAFDRRTGRQRWQRTVSQGGFPEEIHSKNTHATSTVASDGERLFVAFFHHKTIQATALSLDGKILWQKTVGSFEPRRYEYGYAPSPVVYRGTVIVTGEYDGDAFIAALDRASGDEVWRIARPSNVSYSSPVVAHVAGRDQLLISGADQVTSYDPATGRLLWSVKGTTAATCGTVVWEGDMVFASGGFPGSETIAIRASGSGEVVWRNKQRSYEQSLLAHAGYLYGWTDSGVMYCWRTSDGQEMWKKRLQGPISASPIFAGGQVYWSNERGTTFVFRPNPEQFDLVAENKLGDDSFASPAVSRGQLFLRVAKRDGGERQEFLYCIGKVETP